MVKKNKRQRDIKSKLMAAICMLLVSSIMMVSSTYAWFTLSTAPEVTGITTSVGANGNLEMALVPLDGDTSKITSSAGDSLEDWTIKNLTWGNMVDLSNSAFYGLDQIVLFPAALNAGTEDDNHNPLTLKEALLLTPGYGADGRVTNLLENTVTSTYASADSNFPGNSNYGVRAVGTASGMTDRQLAYRNARSAANTSMAQAKNNAATSLNTNGNALANIAITHGTNSAAKHTQADVNALLAIVDDLLGADGETGVLGHIENAYRSYIIAYGASQDGVAAGLTDEAFNGFQNAVNDAATLADAVAVLTGAGITLPDALKNPIDALAATKAKVVEAQTMLNALVGTGDEIAWSSISPALYKLADTDAMTINGVAAKDVTSDEGINTLIQTIGGGLTVTMSSGGGVYADVADHCGDYSASIVIEELKYGSMTVTNMNARMATRTLVTLSPDPDKPEEDAYRLGLSDVYLGVVGTAIGLAGAPATAEGTEMPITDMYGYVIDLAFRTNAAESDLLLQTEAVDRIYSDNGAGAETMGAGSTMTFAATTPDFTNDQVEGLMEAIRIVFFDNAGNVLATAKLDVENSELSADGITADIYLYTIATSTTVTYEAITGDEVGTHVVDDTAASGYRPITDGETGTHKEVTTTGAAAETRLEGTDAVITALTQAQPQAVSVLVYLDGESITNADVAATASTSVTGSMNLQFASSATLVPMEYTGLMDQNAAETTASTTAATTGN